MREISAYARAHGIRPLFDGAVPLMLRELCYITSITVVNPIVTRYLDGKGGSRDKGDRSIMTWQQVMASLSVGMAAGMASAPARECILPFLFQILELQKFRCSFPFFLQTRSVCTLRDISASSSRPISYCTRRENGLASFNRISSHAACVRA